LVHPELIDRFKLGFVNRTLGYRLPEKNRKAGAEMRGKLQEIGILRDSGHEHFNGSLVVPLMDENGIIIEVYGRKILGNRLRKRTAQLSSLAIESCASVVATVICTLSR
jgi:DNA primase